MWWMADVIIMFIFSVALGNWVAGKLYVYRWFDYAHMKDAKAICIIIAGIMSACYLLIRG